MRSAAANILGKAVTYTDADGATKTGVASAVSFSGDTPTVTIGSDSVAFTALTGLATATTAGSATAA
jgi:flagellar basal-body rod modification protein FlgD